MRATLNYQHLYFLTNLILFATFFAVHKLFLRLATFCISEVERSILIVSDNITHEYC